MAIHRVTMSCLVDGQTCQNVIHLDDTAFIGLEPQIADKVESDWLFFIRQFQHSSAQWVSIEVRKVSPAGVVPFKKIVSLLGTGPAESDADNSMLCRMLAFRTGVAGRHGRGFLFIPGTSFQAWSKGLIKAASLAAGAPIVEAMKERWVFPGPSTGLGLVISRKSAPGIVANVTDILQDPTVRSIRRRRIGVGI